MMFYGLLLCFFVSVLNVGSKNVGSVTEYDQKYKFVEKYNKHNPPPNNKGTATNVLCKLAVREVSQIDEMDSAITIFFFIFLTWEDSRVILTDDEFFAKGKRYPLRQDQTLEFWKPDLYVTNMIDYKVKKFYDDLTLMRIHSEGNTTGMYLMEFAELKFKCVMDFTIYPFDVHACPIMFESFSYYIEELTLKWRFKELKPFPHDSTEWNKIPLYSIEMNYTDGYCDKRAFKRRACLSALMIVTREIEYHIFQTYIPSGGFVLISWISFIVTPEAVPGRMVLLVTTLLTLITMYNSVRSSTPPNTGSSLKAIEVWITSCITFVFSALMEYAAVLANRIVVVNKMNRAATIPVEEMKKKPKNKQAELKQDKFTGSVPVLNLVKTAGNKSEPVEPLSLISLKLCRLDKISLFVFPICFFTFCVTYWIYYMRERAWIWKKIHDEHHFKY